MESVQVSKTHPFIAKIIRATYPSWKGRKIRVEASDYPIDCRSYWDGGSRSYFKFLNLATMEVQGVPAQSAFDVPVNGLEAVALPQGVVCVEHSIFCGKDMGLRIHVTFRDAAQIQSPAPLALPAS